MEACKKRCKMNNIYNLKSALKRIKEFKEENQELKNALSKIKSVTNDVRISKEELCRVVNYCGDTAIEILDKCDTK